MQQAQSTFFRFRKLARRWGWIGPTADTANFAYQSLVYLGFFSALSGALAYAMTTWQWYWETFNYAGVAIAFLVALIGLSVSLALFEWVTSKRARRKKQAANSLNAREVSGNLLENPTFVVLNDGSINLIARFATDATNALVLVEFSHWAASVGLNSRWSARTKLRLRSLESAVSKEKVILRLLTRDGQYSAYWGDDDVTGAPPRGERLMVTSGQYRGRVIVKADNREQSVYFIIRGQRGPDNEDLSIIGLNEFEFADGWAALSRGKHLSLEEARKTKACQPVR